MYNYISIGCKLGLKYIILILFQDNYNTYRNNVGALLGSPKREQLSSIRQELETHTDVSKLLAINLNMFISYNIPA